MKWTWFFGVIMAVFIGALLLQPAWAQTPPATTCSGLQVDLAIPGHSGNCYTGFGDYLIALISFAVTVAAGLATLMILWGAFKYTTAGGDDAKVRDAKDIIVGAVIGFALLLLIKVLLPLIQIQ